jgi:phage-related protein
MAEEDILGSNLKDMASKVEDVISSLKDLEKRLSNSNKSIDKNNDEMDGMRLNLKKVKDTLDVTKKAYEDLTKTTKESSKPLDEFGKKIVGATTKFDELSKMASELGVTLETKLGDVAKKATESSAAGTVTSIGDLMNQAKTAEAAAAVIGAGGPTPTAPATTPSTASKIVENTEKTSEGVNEVAEKLETQIDMQKTADAKQAEQMREASDSSSATAAATNETNRELTEAVRQMVGTQNGLRKLYSDALVVPAFLRASSLFGGGRGLLGMGAVAGAEGAAGQVSLLTKIVVGALGGITGFIMTAIPMYKTAILEMGRLLGVFTRSIGPFVSSMFAATSRLLRMLGVVGDGLAFFVDGVYQIGNMLYKMVRGLFTMTGEALSGIATRLGGRFFNLFAKAGETILTSVKSLFSAGGTGILGTIMKSVEFIFGEASLGVFKAAFKFGATIARYIPLLSVIPTVIETVVGAFEKMKTEGVGGVIKSIFVGLLKGIAAFLTLGLSDFILDFEAMYEALSKPLDGIIRQLSDLFGILGEMFSWLGSTLSEIWTRYIQPIAMSIWNNALKPIFGILKEVGEVVAKLIGFVLILLTPVIAIIKFVFKVIFEIVKLLYDLVLKPLLDYLIMPVFNAIMTTVGLVFGVIYEAFAAISDGLTWLNENTAQLMDYITNFFDQITSILGEGAAYIKNSILGWFDWFGDEEAPSAASEMVLQEPAAVQAERLRVQEGITMPSSPSFAAAVGPQAAFTTAAERAGAVGGGSPVIINNASTTNNNVSGGGGSSAIPVPLSPNPVHHLDPTRALIAT